METTMKMKHLAVAAIMSIMAGSAMAAPSIAKVGICTVFEGGNVISKATCSINIDHTPSSKTVTLKSPQETHVINAVHNGKDYAKSNFSLDGAPAEHYLRDAKTNKRTSMSEVQSSNVDTLTCFETMTKNICHS